jgi:hypothetical protein
MILDSEAIFSNKQDLAQLEASSPIVSTNIIRIEPNSSWGAPLRILAQVTEDFDSSSSVATVQLKLLTSTVVGMTSAVTLFDSEAIIVTTLVAGFEFPINFLPNGNLEFLQITYTIATQDTTSGKITAGFVETVQTNKRTFPVQSDS